MKAKLHLAFVFLSALGALVVQKIHEGFTT